VAFEQALIQKLFVELVDLDGIHFALIGGDLAVGVDANGQQFRFGSRA
jgi:hypothetical protein